MPLSEPARDLLQDRLAGRQVEVSPDNLESYRELARAGLMTPVSTFIGGEESLFRLTEEAVRRRAEFSIQRSRFSASAIARSIRRAFSRIGKSVSAAP